MTRAALIGLTVVFTAPAFLLGGVMWGWLIRDREDNEELARMRKVAEECDAILAALQADLTPPKTIPPRCNVLLTCPECGPVEIDSDLITAPSNDAEWDEAMEVILTQHSIQAHLTEWGAA